MEVGDKLASFEVVKIEKRMVREYTQSGKYRLVEKDMYFLMSERGRQRVLREGKTKLSDCETIYVGSSFVFKKWNQI